MKVDLRLVPLIGEALVGKSSGVQFTGSVQFENITDFDEFSRYCQNMSERIQNGDYRAGHLIYSLDFPAHFAPDVLNPIYTVKPTRVALRTALSACQYDREKGVGQVQGTFFGRVVNILQEARSFPAELEGRDYRDGNYSFSPPAGFKGVKGYEILLGKITLAPGDVLTITIPNTQVQLDGLQPHPGGFENTGEQKLVYVGPKSFQLYLPYVPQTSLYPSQFPSILRLSISPLVKQLGNFYPLGGAYETWLLLALGLLLSFLSGFLRSMRRLSSVGWLLILLSFFYGVRGSFGLLCVAGLFYLTQARGSAATSTDRRAELERIVRGLAGFGLIALGVYFDIQGANFFRGLSGPELSPLTPVVLLILVGALFVLLYRSLVKADSFTHSDLPILLLFLAVLALYDAFDKSLLALLILLMAGSYIIRSGSASQGDSAAQNENTFGNDFQRRWNQAFGNRIIPLGILILMIFATLNNLSSTYANDLQVLLPPLVAPLVVPVFAVISVFVSFSSIAWLFILVFPFLPFTTGYLKAGVFALLLFLVFFFGIGTDPQLIDSLPTILIGRFLYYVSVPMLIGVYLDIQEFTQQEDERLSKDGEEKKGINREAVSLYFKNLQGILGMVVGILSLVAPALYTFLSGQPTMVTYFDLLEKLISLQI
jgi:hypothetical protein